MMNHELLETLRVLPVVTATSVDSTVTLARTLHAAGMHGVEITLRTEPALESIRAVRSEVPEMIIASGTVTNPGDLARAIDAGADLHVSPGLTPALLDAVQEAGVDFLPGVATASDIMCGLDRGLDCFKLFPAVAVGGIALLRSLAGPFPDVRFCPTGGLSAENFREFLALPNVLCCGGSWMVSPAMVAAGDWAKIGALASEAMRKS
jgi:2-dehydro-3-deoxyphosphogluconate aldolase/(4S)-4-hydroxy-2-oxoglutarate aldolase